MTYPKKTKGWRKLKLDNQEFRWNFVEKGENSILKLQGANSSTQQVLVTLLEKSTWLSFRQYNEFANEPQEVTSKFASQAIKFALQNGWKPDDSGSAIKLHYKDNNFVLLK